MPKVGFDKEAFKKEVKDNVRVLYRKNLEEATEQQIFSAVCFAAKERIIEEFGYFNTELLTLERKYHKRFCPDKKVSVWTKVKND